MRSWLRSCMTTDGWNLGLNQTKPMVSLRNIDLLFRWIWLYSATRTAEPCSLQNFVIPLLTIQSYIQDWVKTDFCFILIAFMFPEVTGSFSRLSRNMKPMSKSTLIISSQTSHSSFISEKKETKHQQIKPHYLLEQITWEFKCPCKIHRILSSQEQQQKRKTAPHPADRKWKVSEREECAVWCENSILIPDAEHLPHFCVESPNWMGEYSIFRLKRRLFQTQAV